MQPAPQGGESGPQGGGQQAYATKASAREIPDQMLQPMAQASVKFEREAKGDTQPLAPKGKT